MMFKYFAFMLLGILSCALLVSPVNAASTVDFLAGSYTDPSTGTVLPYRLYVPAGYDPSQKYTMTLFLHGAGEQGTNNTSQINGNIDNLLAHCKENNTLLLAPQANAWWGGNQTLAATNLTQLIQTQYSVDTNRTYVTGLSMGGYGTWDIAGRPGLNNVFAAYVPICGGGSTYLAGNMVDLPIWAFHAADDGTVPVQRSREMISAVTAAGGNPLYTEYATGGHGIWGRVYNTDAMYNWLYLQELGIPYGPRLEFQKTDLGNGLYGYTFVIANNDGLDLSYAATIAFEGINGATVQQFNAFGAVAVNSESQANTFQGLGSPPYDKNLDSWVASPFGDNGIPGINPLTGEMFSGFLSENGKFIFSVGSGANSQLGSGVTLAYLVADGDIQWTGQIGRNQKLFNVSGVTPEPLSLMLLTPALILLRRRS